MNQIKPTFHSISNQKNLKLPTLKQQNSLDLGQLTLQPTTPILNKAKN